MKLILSTLFLSLSIFVHSQKFSVKKSALESGNIYKIAIQKSGIYKLTRKNLESLGINVGSINPKEIKIFGNYGGTLPEAVSKSYPDDLLEFPIIVNGESDGKFDIADEIIFYAEGADKWKHNDGKYFYDKNIYVTKNYVFLKISEGNGKRIFISETSDLNPEITTTLNEVSEIYSEDKFNLLGLNPAFHGSGKLWVGESLPKEQLKDFSSAFNLKNLVIGQPIRVDSRSVGRTPGGGNLTLSIGKKVINEYIGSVSFSAGENIYAARVESEETFLATESNPKISITHDATELWLDYISLHFTEIANNDRGQTFYRNAVLNDVSSAKVKLSEMNADLFFDVTNIDQIKGYNFKNGEVIFNTNKDSNGEYLIVKKGRELSPELIGKIENQNLHKLVSEDMIIVYHKNFKDAAEKLAKHRATHNKLVVTTVLVDQIYNEFSAGKLDPTAIRNFAKMIHDKNVNFKYLLLLGDGSFDYKKLLANDGIEHNFVPVYETQESLDPINAFPSDDYYALLSDDDGENLKGDLEINVGRLTVGSAEDANSLVQKIINYDISPARFGEWKIASNFVADDEDSGLHLRDADAISQISFKQDEVINQGKIYLDAYNQESNSAGERYPEVNEDINNNLNKGLLTWAYLGHGSPKGLAQERVVQLNDINNWSNKNSPTLFITATCSFAPYDDHTIKSGGELALANNRGGAIALLTTTRSVYANENRILTENVYKNLYNKEEGQSLPFGEIIRRAKNLSLGDATRNNARKFTLLGDPAQQLALPKHNIKLTTINGINADDFKDTISAYEKVIFTGELNDVKGNKLENFKGKLSFTIFDKSVNIKSLGHDKTAPENFETFRNIIFKGQSAVINGKFTIECILPKDINYSVGYSRISMYANSDSEDAAGVYNKLLVGGGIVKISDTNVPTMTLYMNDEQFLNGGIVAQQSSLFLKLQDELGINTSGSGVGHDITANLKGLGINENFVLNDFYKADANNFKRGSVLFPLPKLEPGDYIIDVKAWNIANNSVSGSLSFKVVGDKNTKLTRVYNYPNPFINSTAFTFEHDLANTNLDVTINIFTMTGKLVRSIKESLFSTGNRIGNFNWNGKDDFESTLAKGLYLYQIKLDAPELKTSRLSSFQKMVKM
jgi:hypothetical protein